MKLKAAATDGLPQSVVDAFGGEKFAEKFLVEIVGDCLGAKNPLDRPAAFYVQHPDVTVRLGDVYGIELRLTGVSRDGRTPAQFHEALKALVALAVETLSRALQESPGLNALRVQLFCFIMLDGQIENAPGSVHYTSVLESEELWVTEDGILPTAHPDVES